jgi:hypothetical protein
MKLVPMDEVEKIPPGIYFVTAESLDFNAALKVVETNLNSPQFAHVEFIHLIATQRVQVSKFNTMPEILHCIVAVIKIK